MKSSIFSILFVALAMHGMNVSAQDIGQDDICQEQQTAVDNCFSSNCTDCTPIDLRVSLDASRSLPEVENEVDVTTDEAKECCSACSDEIDALVACFKPTVCLDGDCLADNVSAATIAALPVVQVALCTIVVMAATIGGAVV